MIPRKFNGFRVPEKDDYISARTPILFNKSITISLAAPRKWGKDYFYKNASCDELIFVHKGSGVLQTQFGELAFSPGDYLVIPKGIIYTMKLLSKQHKFLIVESAGELAFPRRYLNGYGQFQEHAPFCERDIKLPGNLQTIDALGEYPVYIKKEGILHRCTQKAHPFDVIGWDGRLYPFGFSIYDFEPITGRIHQPPPVHQTFAGDDFVICSFVPRLYDYHPDAIPAPYHHSNLDSDELLYYVEGDFMSRNDIGEGYMTLHPAGIPHGPHPGTIEQSIGKTETKEYAVMIDPFSPLKLTQAALDLQEDGYEKSWL
jgi:homogentisate 1,2-dioxygenase